MSAMPPNDGASVLKPALRTTDGDANEQTSSSLKAVQIVDPEEDTATEDNVPRKQFNAGIGARRLSGRMPSANMATKALLATVTGADSSASQPADATSAPNSNGANGANGAVPSPAPGTITASPLSMAQSSMSESAPASTPAGSSSAPSSSAQIPMGSHCRSKYHHASEMLLDRVGEWLDRERKKMGRRKRVYPSKKAQAPAPSVQAGDGEELGPRKRSDSIDSQSSEVSLDRLQRILDDSMSNMGISPAPPVKPSLGKRPSSRRRGHPKLSRVPSSDTEYIDGEAVVPTCEATLDNSKASYSGGSVTTEDVPASLSAKETRSRQAWTTFKNEVIRLAHTLRLKGWRSVPLDGGDKIGVERLSGALTNAVYVVSPPKESELVPMASASGRPLSRKTPKKILLRVYGPFVDQLIDRQTELKVLRRLAKKKIGPRLLGTFSNGRFEEYFNAAPLNFAEMRDPETSRQIAKRMRELHEGIELLESEKDDGPKVWRNWDKWLDNVGKRVLQLDEVVRSEALSPQGPWRSLGFVCGVPWELFKELVDRHKEHVNKFYGGDANLREHLVFAHNDTQYGNILRQRPDDQKSPLLQPANKHKQLIVIDFEYAAANVAGLEFANHFTEWCYNYHADDAPYVCDPRYYPTAEEQYRFIKAYVDHRPQYPLAGSTPRLTPLDSPAPSQPATASSSIVDFMLDARGSSSQSLVEEERAREEKSDGIVGELVEETRLWRAANSAQWVAWGIIQAKMGAADQGHGEGDGKEQNGHDGHEGEEGAGEHEFDYLSYAQDRALFFLGDCLQMGIVTREELGGVADLVKIVEG